jgi:hypothetical protein
MIALGVAATWIAISIAGAKGLVLFARAAASGELDVESSPVAAQSRPGPEDIHRYRAPAHAPGASR